MVVSTDEKRAQKRLWMRRWRAAHPDEARARSRQNSAAYRARKRAQKRQRQGK
jgi:hypothetical protein